MNIKRFNSKIFYYYDIFKKIFKKKSHKKLEIDKSFNYEEFLGSLNLKEGSQVFIHAGLKDIKNITGNSYENISKKIIFNLKELYNLETVITPSFTPSFRNSGVYSKNYSKGEYGVFTELPRHFGGFRTNDAIHNVVIFSDYPEKFKYFNYHDTFAEDGFYASLNRDNTYIINVSTKYFVSTYLHYIEESLNVPYKRKNAVYTGVLIDENNNITYIKQKNHAYLYKVSINRKKLEKELKKEGVLQELNYKNLRVSCILVKDLDEIVRNKILNNPYWLVTF